MAQHVLSTADIRKALPTLNAGDTVSLSGMVYTARDAAHGRIFELLDAGKSLPFDLADAAIYYAGPTPARPGEVIGSCGPTTSGRMDKFAPRLISLGLVCMIGKGGRSPEVVGAMQRYGAVYLAAVGGAGALISKTVRSAEEIAFPELGCESVKRLYVRDFPAVVAIDARGRSLFQGE